MKISACWITKNECGLLMRSISSVKEIADELIVVDTGSTDNTAEAAENLGAKVFNFEWIDDFSAARNYAIKQASGDIIIFLDSDEWFEPKRTKDDRREIQKALSSEKIQALSITIRNLDDSGTVFNTAFVQRIFKNQKDLRYINKIHETLFLSSGLPPAIDILSNWSLNHSGYAKAVKRDKVKRNIEILEKEKYKKGDYRETARIFYLMREHYNNGNFEEAFPYLDMLLHEQKHVSNLITYYGSLGTSYFPVTMEVASKYRRHISRRDIYKTLVGSAQKLLPGRIETSIIELNYKALFDNKERAFLENLEIYEKEHGNEAEKNIKLDGHYKSIFFYIYGFSAYAYFRREKKEEAGMYAIKAFRSIPSAFASKTLQILLWVIEGASDSEIAGLLMRTLETSNQVVMEGMMESLMYEKYKNIYLYFFKKQLENDIAKRNRFIYLKILLGDYEETLDVAIDNKNGMNPAEISEMVFLAIICSGSKELYIKGKKHLGIYGAITKSFFDGIPLKAPNEEEKSILRGQYANIMFAAGVEAGEKFLSVFANEPILKFMVKCDYYMAGGLYEAFLSELKALNLPWGASGAWEMLADCYIGAKRYEDAFAIFGRLLEHEIINFNILNGVLLISEMAQGGTAAQARELYDIYMPIWDEIVDLADVVQTGTIFDESTRKETRVLSALSLEEFEKRLSETPPITVNALRISLMEVGKIYEEKKLYTMAERCYRRLLAGGWEIPEVYERLGRLYEALGNESLATELLKN